MTNISNEIKHATSKALIISLKTLFQITHENISTSSLLVCYFENVYTYRFNQYTCEGSQKGISSI